MMQVTRTAFQAFANLNEQATDPKSHTLVGNFYTRFSPVPLPAIPMVDPGIVPCVLTTFTRLILDVIDNSGLIASNLEFLCFSSTLPLRTLRLSPAQ
jgi:hypothetical protein